MCLHWTYHVNVIVILIAHQLWLAVYSLQYCFANALDK
jgi:hypothetical protein